MLSFFFLTFKIGCIIHLSNTTSRWVWFLGNFKHLEAQEKKKKREVLKLYMYTVLKVMPPNYFHGDYKSYKDQKNVIW